MKTLIKLTNFSGDDIFIVTDKIVAFFADNRGKGGSKIWVGANEDDYFFVQESPQEIVQLMYGLSEVPSWLREKGGGND